MIFPAALSVLRVPETGSSRGHREPWLSRPVRLGMRYKQASRMETVREALRASRRAHLIPAHLKALVFRYHSSCAPLGAGFHKTRRRRAVFVRELFSPLGIKPAVQPFQFELIFLKKRWLFRIRAVGYAAPRVRGIQRFGYDALVQKRSGDSNRSGGVKLSASNKIFASILPGKLFPQNRCDAIQSLTCSPWTPASRFRAENDRLSGFRPARAR